jgi:hypothetical protein
VAGFAVWAWFIVFVCFSWYVVFGAARVAAYGSFMHTVSFHTLTFSFAFSFFCMWKGEMLWVV